MMILIKLQEVVSSVDDLTPRLPGMISSPDDFIHVTPAMKSSSQNVLVFLTQTTKSNKKREKEPKRVKNTTK